MVLVTSSVSIEAPGGRSQLTYRQNFINLKSSIIRKLVDIYCKTSRLSCVILNAVNTYREFAKDDAIMSLVENFMKSQHEK